VMEFVDGPSLADLLAVDPIEAARALDVIAQAAEGLAAAHKAGVVHRDIKPGNILISSEGQVKVTDFGIAHAAGQAPVTAPGLVMGTTQYMAPERIAGNPGTAASDLYALGIVLHECLTGMPPHDGTAADVMAAHLYLPLPPLPADVPAELDVLVDRLTTKDPARRIGDARELADLAARLRDAIAGGALVPPARAAARSGAGAGAASRAPQSAALTVDPWYDQTGAGPYSTGNTGSTGGTGNTALLAAANAFAGHAYVSDEWSVPPPTNPPGPGQPGQGQGNPRRRGGAAVAAGAVAVAGAGLVALLVSGAFSGSPTANQAHTGPSTASTSATGQTPSHSASGAARPSGPGGAAAPSTVATSAATSPKATPGGKKPSASPSGHPGTGSAPSGSGSATPSGGTSSGSPSTSPATSPSGTPAPSTSGSPSPTSCFLGICL
jgi:hypothetical protein